MIVHLGSLLATRCVEGAEARRVIKCLDLCEHMQCKISTVLRVNYKNINLHVHGIMEFCTEICDLQNFLYLVVLLASVLRKGRHDDTDTSRHKTYLCMLRNGSATHHTGTRVGLHEIYLSTHETTFHPSSGRPNH